MTSSNHSNTSFNNHHTAAAAAAVLINNSSRSTNSSKHTIFHPSNPTSLTIRRQTTLYTSKNHSLHPPAGDAAAVDEDVQPKVLIFVLVIYLCPFPLSYVLISLFPLCKWALFSAGHLLTNHSFKRPFFLCLWFNRRAVFMLMFMWWEFGPAAGW
jgi:hypothetical protein